jgi:BlaI family transcriptional regulator, penicillinase repressor
MFVKGEGMTTPKLSKLELRIMEVLWDKGDCSVREVQEAFPEEGRPAFSTIQTTLYRMEVKQVVARAKKIGNSLIFTPLISRSAAQRRLIDDLLSSFGGCIQPVVAHLVKSGKFTSADVKEAQKLLEELAEGGESR